MNLLREYIRVSPQNSALSDRRYITEVLCVKIPLHESYPFSPELQSRILYEHMLLEGFWSEVKEMAGTTKQLFSTFKEVTTDPNLLSSFSSIIGKTAKYPVKQMYKLLDTIIDTLAKHEDKFPTFVSWAKKLKAFMKKLVDKVYGVDGWKGVLVKTSFALAIKYLWDNVGEMVTAVNDGFKSLLTKLKDDLTGDKLDELMDKVKDFLKEKLSPVIDWVKEKFMSLAGKLVTQFSGIGAWFDWAKSAFEGAKFVLGFLASPLKKFGGIKIINKSVKSERVLREYIRELLTEATSLPDEYFSTIDEAISSSLFWEQPNSQDDIDIYSSPSGSVMGTPATETLSKALHDAMDGIGLEMDVLVRSHDTDDLEGLTLHPEHPAWPNRWLVDAKWYVSSQRKGRNTIDIELMTSEPEDDISASLDSAALIRHIAQTIRHELVHYEQMKKQAANKGLSDTDTFAEMLADPSQVPPSDLESEEWQRKYLESHIEIDAHAHDGAEELLAVYTDKEIKDILRGGIDTNDANLPNAILHYYEILGPNNKATQKFMSKLYTQVTKLQ